LASLSQSAGTQQTINQKNPTNFGKVYLHSLRDFIMSIMKIDSIHIVINNISNVSYRSKDGKSISTNVNGSEKLFYFAKKMKLMKNNEKWT